MRYQYLESCAETHGDLQRIWNDAVIFCGPVMLGHVRALIDALAAAADIDGSVE